MQRRTSTLKPNSTQKSKLKPEFDAERSIRALEDRVAKLERAQGNGIGPLEDLAFDLPAKEQKRPGPKPLHFQALLSDRDELVQMLESYWPEIESLCSPKPNAASLARVFAAIQKQMRGRYEMPAKHLLHQLSVLAAFISTDRFRRDPRQIANAFAGFPKVGIWRSLKLCQSTPCTYPIGERAIRAYIRRKHSELYGTLSADYSLTNFATAIRDYRTKDSALSPFTASYLFGLWKNCLPNYASIGLGLIEMRSRQPK